MSTILHPTAVVHPGATIGAGVEIGPYCIVGERVTLGDGTRLLAHVVVGGSTTIGSECRIYPFSSIGTASQDRKYTGEAAFTTIGDRTTIREYVTINRATGENQTTAVGNDCLLLAYTHIAHNCVLGDHVTMSNLAQLSGHVTVEDHAWIAGAAGVHQFVRVGTYSLIGGMSKIVRDVPPYFLAEGNPSELYGLNVTGLQRSKFSAEVRAELKTAFRLLYHAGLRRGESIEALRAHVVSPEGRHLLAFLEAPSERGVMKGRPGRADDAAARLEA